MRTNGGTGQLFTRPLSSPHISCLLSFFKGNLFLDISKTHLKAVFTLWLPPPSASVLPPPPTPVAPDVSPSPFLGSRHSFDLILSAICNPLQDTEARSPRHHPPLSHSLSAFLFLCSLWTLPFLSFTISSPLNYLAAPQLC